MKMAVFLLNNCKFHGCGRAFPTLADLIHHIEDSHIDADPKNLEKQEVQQPSSLALSYILKHFAKGLPKNNNQDVGSRKKNKSRLSSQSQTMRSVTPTGSELGDEDDVGSEDEDSDDPYGVQVQEEFTTELILGMMQNLKDGDIDKPFACPVPSCKKRYKNVNGMKYHARHGHQKDNSLCCRVKKAFRCKCGKSYMQDHKLRAHMITHHTTTDLLKQTTTPILLTKAVAALPSVNQISSTTPLMTNALFATSVAHSVLASGSLAHTTSLNLVPVTVTTTKQGQITLAGTGATLQLIGCQPAGNDVIRD